MREPRTSVAALALSAGIALALVGCASSGGGDGLLGGGTDDTTTSSLDPVTTQRPPTTSGGGGGSTTTTAGTGGADDMVAAMAKRLEFLSAATEEIRTCIAEAWVDQVGVDRLTESAVTPERLEAGEADISMVDLTEEEGEDLAQAMLDCDFGEPMRLAVENESLFSAPDPSEGLRDCVRNAIDDEAVLAFWGNLLRDEPELFSELDAAAPIQACFASD